MEVGVKELHDNLSRYLNRVKDGEELVVTDRGRAVARVLPIGGEDVFDRLVAEGVIIPPLRPKSPAEPPIKTRGPVSDLIPEQRR